MQFEIDGYGPYSFAYVYHLEKDLAKNDGTILYSDENSISNNDNGNMIADDFTRISGFKQLNSTHIAIVDTYSHCVYMLHRGAGPRGGSTTQPFAGKCGPLFNGFIDGVPGRFDGPWAVELTKEYLLVTDLNNHALRSINILTGTVGTVIKAGLHFPRGMAWYKNRLLVTNAHYVSVITWELSIVSSTILAGTTQSGYKDGPFSTARFDHPYDIGVWADDIYIVADYYNDQMRALDMKRMVVLPVCISSKSKSDADCKVSTKLDYPVSLTATDDGGVIVGRYEKMTKLIGLYQISLQHS